MKLIELNRQQIIEIYNSRMVNDFPPDELRPMKMMLDQYDHGIFSCYALIDEDIDGHVILAYSCFIKLNNHYLFDYFAVADHIRNSGIGTPALKLINEKFISENIDCVIGEIEDPEYATTEDDKLLQSRRYNFYLRNGYRDTGVKVKLFDVDYIILELILPTKHSEIEIKDIYQAHYKAMLPMDLYERMVIIH